MSHDRHITALHALLGQLLVVSCLLTLSGCAGLAEKNYRITGETRPYQVDQGFDVFNALGYGALHLPHDIMVKDEATERATVEEGIKPQFYEAAVPDESTNDVICISLNRCFLKYLEEIGKPEVFAYVEVEDGVGKDPLQYVFFKDDYQPQGALLNFQDAIIYGPTVYSGQPITIHFYVYELDREEDELASSIVTALSSLGQEFSGPYGLVAGVVGNVIKTIVTTDVDDREFYHRITLKPIKKGQKYPEPYSTALRTGTYVIVKREIHRRVSPEAIVDFKKELEFPLQWQGGESVEMPKIVCRSGELYQHKLLKTQMLDPLKRKSDELQARVDQYEKDLARAEIREVKGKAAVYPSKKALEDDLMETVDAVYETVYRSNRTYAAGSPEADEFGNIGGDVETQEAAEAADTDEDDETQSAPRLSLKDYDHYRSKSYLTFTVENHLAPVDKTVLDEIYKKSAEEIEKTLNTSVDTRQLSEAILNIGKQTADAIVSLIAKENLQGLEGEERKERLDLLKSAYPGHDDVFDNSAARLGAREELRRAKEPKAKLELERILEERMETTVNSLLKKLEDPATFSNLSGEKLDDLERMMRSVFPQAMPALQPLLNAMRGLGNLDRELNDTENQ